MAEQKSVIVQPVPAHMIEAIWPTILPGLNRTLIESGDELKPETVYDRLTEGSFLLWVVLLEEKYAGFVISCLWFTDKKRWVDVPFAYSKESRGAGLMEVTLQTLESYASSMGLDGVKFISPRRGYDRVAPKLGYKRRMVEWVKEV